MPDLVDDEDRIVDVAVSDEPEETREARTSFLTPLPRVRMTWPPLIPPPAFPELFPLRRLPVMQVSPPTGPDEEGEHMTDVESPNPMEDASAPSFPIQVPLRVTLDIDPNSQLYICHLRLRPSAASYVGALIMMNRSTFFVAAAPYRSGSPVGTAGLI